MTMALLGQPILSVECDEPEGKIVRTIRPLRLSKESLHILFYRFRQFRTIIGLEFDGSFEQFCSLFLSQNKDGSIESNGIFWVVDDFVGIFYITEYRPGVDAVVHYSFFDRRHKGRIALIHQMMKYVFEVLDFHRLTVKIPLYAKPSVMYFTESFLGFEKEGRLVEAVKFDDKWFDINIYGITKDKFFKRLKNGPTN